MQSNFKRITLATTLSFVFAASQMFLPVTFAEPNRTRTNPPSPQQLAAVLTTNSNQPITVNGASAVSGATLLSGATLETPDRVAASTNIPGHSLLEIYQKSKLILTFDQSSVKVTLIHGCVVLHTMTGTSGQVVKQNGGVIGSSDSSKAGVINVCETPGSGAPPIRGANTAMIALLVVGGAAAIIIPLAARGRNPSPGAP